jgi:hypothetical protein
VWKSARVCAIISLASVLYGRFPVFSFSSDHPADYDVVDSHSV